MAFVRTYAEINEKIKKGTAVVMTAEEIKSMAEKEGLEKGLHTVDVVTTATFGAMCSTGAFINFGHADPPIKMTKIWLNNVPAYGGIAAVDAYIGATELSDDRGLEYGGAHVIEDLISGKKVKLRAISSGTDCYPRKDIETIITKDDLNQFYLFNPRNAYQNYVVAVNSSNRLIYTYMGTLLPNFGNATYTTSSQLSPLINDPFYRTIGIGTRIFLGGAIGYVAWQGTQHNPKQERDLNGIPITLGGTLALIGDAKKMQRRYIRAASFQKYGTTMYVGVGVPIPLLDLEMMKFVSIRDKDIKVKVFDYSLPGKPCLGKVNYAQLRSGTIDVSGKKIPTAPLASLYMAREIARLLKEWIQKGQFLLVEPIEKLPLDIVQKTLKIK